MYLIFASGKALWCKNVLCYVTLTTTPFSPIAIFCYNRPQHLRRTVNALLLNPLAAGSPLFVFSDGPKTPLDAAKVAEVREYLRSVTGFKEITVIAAEKNKGLSQSVIDGVGELVNRYGKIIVLEDDMLTAPFFLDYMNEALDKYASEEKVISIHGYSYPVRRLERPFFLGGADCWGWATWKRGWDLFESDGQKLLTQLREQKRLRRFNFNGTYPYEKMLLKQIRGENSSWAIRWYASALLQNKFTLYPGYSLVKNIGNDDSGTHSKATDLFHPLMAQHKPDLQGLEVKESGEAYIAFCVFFLKIYGSALLAKVKFW